MGVFSLFFLTEVEPPVSEVQRFVVPHPEDRHLPGQRHVEDVLHAQPAVLRAGAAPTVGGLGFREDTLRCVLGLLRVPAPSLGIYLKEHKLITILNCISYLASFKSSQKTPKCFSWSQIPPSTDLGPLSLCPALVRRPVGPTLTTPALSEASSHPWRWPGMKTEIFSTLILADFWLTVNVWTRVVEAWCGPSGITRSNTLPPLINVKDPDLTSNWDWLLYTVSSRTNHGNAQMEMMVYGLSFVNFGYTALSINVKILFHAQSNWIHRLLYRYLVKKVIQRGG